MENKQSWLPLGIAALGIIGTLLAGSMQYFWGGLEKRDQAFEEHRRKAYEAFIGAIDKPRLADRLNSMADSMLADAEKEKKDTGRAKELRNEAQAFQKEATDLKNEYELTGGAAVHLISIYADKEVVEAYANYLRARDSKGEESYGPCGKTWKEDLAIYQAIRRSSMGANQNLENPKDLAFSALFCDPDKPADAQRAPAKAPQALSR